jgi:[ribosomal protein S5]-alanine N-acetyltransferase
VRRRTPAPRDAVRARYGTPPNRDRTAIASAFRPRTVSWWDAARKGRRLRRLLWRPSTPESKPRPLATRPGGRVELRDLVLSDRDAFLEMVRESRDLHRPWTYPPERPEQFDDLVSRSVRDDFACLVTTLVHGGDLVGVFTISQIVRGYFQSAYLGYYASARHAGKGLMSESMALVLDHVFGPLSLHRLEANIQPGNAPSIALARGAGFRLEGFSPRYLLIGGRWRDHERYAITADEHAQNRAA